MHRIGFFVCHGHDALDLGGPLSAFNQVATAAGHTPYDLHVVSQSGGPVPGNTGIAIETKPIGKRTFDTVVFVGGDLDPMQTRRTSQLPRNWPPGPREWQACAQERFCWRKPACWTD